MRIHRLAAAVSAALLSGPASPTTAQLPEDFDAAWNRLADAWRGEATSHVAAIGAFHTVGAEGGGPDTNALRVGTRDRVANEILSLLRSAAR